MPRFVQNRIFYPCFAVGVTPPLRRWGVFRLSRGVFLQEVAVWVDGGFMGVRD